MPLFTNLKLEILRIGLPAEEAEFMWDYWLANGFRNGKGPVRDWKAVLRVWKARKWFPSQKERPPLKIQSNELTEAAIDELEKRFPKLAPIRDFLPDARAACARSHCGRGPMGRRFLEVYLEHLSAEPPGLIAHKRFKPAVLKEATRDRAEPATDAERKKRAEDLRKFRKTL
jgi:hypothetical protein